jgi:hypothetical protein
MGNIAFLMYQGVPPQPVATFERWKQLDRQVQRGSRAFYILRPINVKFGEEDEDGNQRTMTRFQPVKSVFPLSMTEGAPLPEVEHPLWSKDRALGTLGINLVTFEEYNPNIQGYSYGKNVAVSAVAKYPEKTLVHEIAHVQAGHTQPQPTEAVHRGVGEFEAEGTAHLVLNELGLLTPDMAEVSRGYIQGWLRGEKPPEHSIRKVFKITDQILNAGYGPVEEAQDD